MVQGLAGVVQLILQDLGFVAGLVELLACVFRASIGFAQALAQCAFLLREALPQLRLRRLELFPEPGEVGSLLGFLFQPRHNDAGRGSDRGDDAYAAALIVEGAESDRP